MVTLLVLENMDTFRDIVTEDLQEEGYEVISASSVQEARELIKDKQLDLAILDIKMPGETGLDMANSLNVTHPDVQIIFSTGYWDDKMMAQINSKQVVDLFFKPFDLDELKKRIKEILNNK